MSFVGNCGTFTRGYKAMIMDVEFLYHLLYLLICALGLFVHEFFYSLLVGIHLLSECFPVSVKSHLGHIQMCCPPLAFWFGTGQLLYWHSFENRLLEVLLGRSYGGRLWDTASS